MLNSEWEWMRYKWHNVTLRSLARDEGKFLHLLRSLISTSTQVDTDYTELRHRIFISHWIYKNTIITRQLSHWVSLDLSLTQQRSFACCCNCVTQVNLLCVSTDVSLLLRACERSANTSPSRWSQWVAFLTSRVDFAHRLYIHPLIKEWKLLFVIVTHWHHTLSSEMWSKKCYLSRNSGISSFFKRDDNVSTRETREQISWLTTSNVMRIFCWWIDRLYRR